RQPGLDLGPCPAGVVAAPDVAAEPEDERRVARGEDAEETAVVRNRYRLEPLRRRIELQHEARFARDIEIARDRTDRIEIEEFRVVRAIEPPPPPLATVRRSEDQVVRAYDVAVPRVGEPDIEERLIGPLLLVAPRLG